MDYLSFSFLAIFVHESKVQEYIKSALAYLIENQFLVQADETDADGITKQVFK